MTQPSGPTRVRSAFASVLRDLTVLVLGTVLVGSLLGSLIAGMPGLWGALLGAGVAAFFSLTTAIIMVRTADRPMHVMNAWIVGAWILKMGGLFALLVALRGRTFYEPRVFFVVLVVAIIGATALEMVQLQRARIPVVDLTQRAPTAPPEQPDEQ
ncbi:hypothetical protein ACTVCO_03910 [Sanguibacter sp. A247]|uniref:hypothetical protein n=1 Tax=unclassified Sanguibacter TaxID=2645534 RepID=UPI003FD87E67